jgi:hypothetical protein
MVECVFGDSGGYVEFFKRGRPLVLESAELNFVACGYLAISNHFVVDAGDEP